MTLLLVSLAGGLGAVTRFVVDALVNRRGHRGPWPRGTLLINVTGSFLLGLVTGLAATRSGAGVSTEVVAVAGTGFCGGYTTFSTASIEVVRLWLADGPSPALGYALAGVLGSIAAAALGLLVAAAL